MCIVVRIMLGCIVKVGPSDSFWLIIKYFYFIIFEISKIFNIPTVQNPQSTVDAFVLELYPLAPSKLYFKKPFLQKVIFVASLATLWLPSPVLCEVVSVLYGLGYAHRLGYVEVLSNKIWLLIDISFKLSTI